MKTLLRHAGEHRVSIATAAHEIDPDGKLIDIKMLVAAIDAKNAQPSTCAGDYHKQCLLAADQAEAQE